jgi:hypothetical protein
LNSKRSSVNSKSTLGSFLNSSSTRNSEPIGNANTVRVVRKCNYYIIEPDTTIIQRELCARKTLAELRSLAVMAEIPEYTKMTKSQLCEKLAMFENNKGRKYIIGKSRRKGKTALCSSKSAAYLQKLVRERGLDSKGTKKELCRRLL